MKRTLFILLSLLLLCPACQAQWKKEGERVENSLSQKAVGGFGAHVVIADRSQAFIQEWMNPPSGKPQLWSSPEAKRGEPIAAFIMFAGCQPDNRGVCNAEVDFRVYKPDGTLYAERKGLELWKKVAPPAPNTQLSSANMVIRIQPNDPSGEYKVKASVRDLNRDVSFEVEEKFKVK